MTLLLGSGISTLTWHSLGLGEGLIGIACLADGAKSRCNVAAAQHIVRPKQTLMPMDCQLCFLSTLMASTKSQRLCSQCKQIQQQQPPFEFGA